MSDSHLATLRLPPFGLIGNGDGGSYSGEIDHTGFLSDNIGSLFLNTDFSDVVFVVDGEKFPAHKVLLAARSEYFRAMLYGGLKESDEGEIILEETNVFAFRILLKCVSILFFKLYSFSRIVFLIAIINFLAISYLPSMGC
ncbi:BTB/POZ domain protein [Ancylostoma caninum]|uniref:BTB/POZ domain protein n=1 Tax=Ancylostoma caninum TaxID=29170 RepID=A0A368GP84_ANCCA|nr:BTB/POZ domain protein [Ancylostoma caninum]